MSQRSIHSYFKATPPKRMLSGGDGLADKSPAKRLKSADSSSPSKNGSSSSPSKNGNSSSPSKNGNSSSQSKNGNSSSPSVNGSIFSPSVDVNARIERQVKLTPALSSNIGPSWFTALEPEFRKHSFRGLSSYLQEERRTKTVFPPAQDVFSWTVHCRMKDVKVVIIGQDPYHGFGQAHGLCFSVKKGVQPPPSLLNIFRELTTDIPGFSTPRHGDLTGWAKQGVLLLNAVLTVRQGEPNSHANHGWESLTDAVIKWINGNLRNVVFLLWGAYAQKKASVVSGDKHLVLKTVHPSPLSAHRGFFGCKHFSKANEYLKEHGKDPVDWKEL